MHDNESVYFGVIEFLLILFFNDLNQKLFMIYVVSTVSRESTQEVMKKAHFIKIFFIFSACALILYKLCM